MLHLINICDNDGLSFIHQIIIDLSSFSFFRICRSSKEYIVFDCHFKTEANSEPVELFQLHPVHPFFPMICRAFLLPWYIPLKEIFLVVPNLNDFFCLNNYGFYTLWTERNNSKGNESKNFWKFGDVITWKKFKKETMWWQFAEEYIRVTR